MCVCVHHWISFDSWRPYEWVISTISCSQQPSSVPVIHVCGFFYGVNPSVFGLPLFLLSPKRKHYYLLQRTLTSYDAPEVTREKMMEINWRERNGSVVFRFETNLIWLLSENNQNWLLESCPQIYIKLVRGSWKRIR